MSFIAVVQARFSSTRLPKKIIMSLDEEKERPAILEHLIERVQKVNLLKIIIAVPKAEYEFFSDLYFLESCKIIAGSTYNVYERFVSATSAFQPNDYLLRLTADNPFIDHEILSKNIDYVKETEPEYSYPRWLPLGMGYEIIKISTLRSLMNFKLTQAQKEHVTTYIKKNKNSFKIKPFPLNQKKYPFRIPIRLTVDEVQDLKMVRDVFRYFSDLNIPFFTAKDVIKLYMENSSFFQRNQNIVQKSASTSQT